MARTPSALLSPDPGRSWSGSLSHQLLSAHPPHPCGTWILRPDTGSHIPARLWPRVRTSRNPRIKTWRSMVGSAEASLGARGLRGHRALEGSSTETGTRAVCAASLHRAEVCAGREKESGFSSTLRRTAEQSELSSDHKCPAWGRPRPWDRQSVF